MTPKEFKAWFDGFTEALEGTPNVHQWARIKERVAEIDGREVTREIYRDRYWPSWPRPYYGRSPYEIYLSTNNAKMDTDRTPRGGLGLAAPAMQQAYSKYSAESFADKGEAFDSSAAMRALGKAEWETSV